MKKTIVNCISIANSKVEFRIFSILSMDRRLKTIFRFKIKIIFILIGRILVKYGVKLNFE